VSDYLHFQDEGMKNNTITVECLLDKKKILIEKKFGGFNNIIGGYFYEL
jgi:hypothetical protein